jgi:hypothetical protein
MPNHPKLVVGMLLVLELRKKEIPSRNLTRKKGMSRGVQSSSAPYLEVISWS